MSVNSRRRSSLTREVVVKDGTIGVLVGREFESCTNFVVDVVSAVGTSEVGPTCGYIFRVTVDEETKNVYVSYDNLRRLGSFTKAVAKTLPFAMSCTGIRSTEWSKYISELTQEYMGRNSNRRRMMLASFVGRQPHSSIWVFGPDCQIDGHGHLMQEVAYFWHPCHKFVAASNIHVPLRRETLKDVIVAQKDCLDNNFLSFFLALAGGIVLFHCEALHDVWDQYYPVMLLYSKECETGKTASLDTILHLFGSRTIYTASSTTPWLLQQAGFSTCPIGVDGFGNSRKLEKLVEAFFDACNSFSRGNRQAPKSGLLITANCSADELQRHGRRIVHIPFWVASRGAGFSFQREEKLHATLKVASSAVGEIIRLKDALLSPLTQTYVTQHLLPFLNRHLLRVHHRVTECYAWILVAARLVCELVPSVVTFSEVMSYFVDKVCPVINTLQGHPHGHASGGAIPATLLTTEIGDTPGAQNDGGISGSTEPEDNVHGGGSVSRPRVPEPDKVCACGPGLEKATALEAAKFTVDTSEAGDGNVDITMSGPADCEVNVEDKGDGTYHCTYVAPRPGVYNIDVKFADQGVPGTPFDVTCTRPPPDASKCVISGLENPGSFKVDCSKAGGFGVPEVSVSGKYAPCKGVFVKHNGDYTFDVSYDIREPGEMAVSVSWHGQHLNGSPYTVSNEM